MGTARHLQRGRILAAVAALVLEVGLAVVLVKGLASGWVKQLANSSLVVMAFPTPPPQPTPPPRKVARASGQAAPPAPKTVPKVEPKPKIALASPSPAATASGAASAGNGSGAGGTGNGNGAGSGGNGTGSGIGAPAQRVAGGLSDRDYPRDAEASGTVGIAFRVRTDGAVDGCRVLASSGSARLDGLTCSLVEQRFRYRPALDAGGRPVDSTLRTSFTWGTRRGG